jgi:hypothetical protein
MDGTNRGERRTETATPSTLLLSAQLTATSALPPIYRNGLHSYMGLPTLCGEKRLAPTGAVHASVGQGPVDARFVSRKRTYLPRALTLACDQNCRTHPLGRIAPLVSSGIR